jgi:hypothetical protein
MLDFSTEWVYTELSTKTKTRPTLTSWTGHNESTTDERNHTTMNAQLSTKGYRQLHAEATRARRQRNGAYPTPAQKEAFRKLLNLGAMQLDATDIELLASHPQLTASQRRDFAELAETMDTNDYQPELWSVQ